MLLFPNWRAPVAGDGCRVPQWTPPERFASYIARPFYIPPPQLDEEDSTGGSSPERCADGAEGAEGEVAVCAWRGCGAHFAGVARLSAHVARAHAHAQRDGLFYCGWKGCSRPQRGFNARYKMLVHVRTHTNERPHACNLCNKSFSRAENLKIHLRSHSGEKPYICPYEGCGKAYSNSSDRFKHARTHTVDKPYFCKVPGCNKRYTDPSSLRKHVKTYKHFTPKDNQKIDNINSSDELHTPERSPEFQITKENNPTEIKIPSPVRLSVAYSPPRCPVSPTMHTNYSLQTDSMQRVPVPVSGYSPIEQMTYIRPYAEPMYPMRVPSYEMSYMEYSQMYDHAYRSYYGLGYPVLRSAAVSEKATYDVYNDVTINKETIDVSRYSPMEIEEMPLNLKCSKRLECKSIEELVRRTDLPLDLSTKS